MPSHNCGLVTRPQLCENGQRVTTQKGEQGGREGSGGEERRGERHVLLEHIKRVGVEW